MNGGKKIIAAKCPLFACRDCRTKTGWPHQSWCGAPDRIKPGCGDCFYYQIKAEKCAHPTLKRKGREII